jgi:hypothetical protein
VTACLAGGTACVARLAEAVVCAGLLVLVAGLGGQAERGGIFSTGAVRWSYGIVLRLPACQSSSTPAVPGWTPKLRSWGRSRRLRLSSAKPGKAARAVT